VTDQYPPPPDPTGTPTPPPPGYPPQVDPYASPADPQQAYAPAAYPPPSYQQPPGYPPPGYQLPPGYPPQYDYPGYPPADPGVNGFAIWALVTGFFGFIGAVLATVFGLIALNQIGKTGQRGRGLAIAGLSLAGGWLLVLVAVIVVGVAVGDTSSASRTPGDTVVPTVAQSTPTDEPTEEATTIDKFTPGQCLNGINGSRSPVTCAAPHDGEVYAVYDLKNGKWPGQATVKKQAEAGCNTRLDSYAKHPAKLDFYYLYPDELSWPDDRSVVCIAADPNDKKLTGSVRR
jgi:hypothetical protein